VAGASRLVQSTSCKLPMEVKRVPTAHGAQLSPFNDRLDRFLCCVVWAHQQRKPSLWSARDLSPLSLFWPCHRPIQLFLPCDRLAAVL
jgi:hypothetical protein